MKGGLGNGKVQPTLDELTATLSRSSLPSVIIEGDDDVIVFRKLEELYADHEVSVFPVGGRTNVLRIFDATHGTTQIGNLIFIVDQDAWTIAGVPDQYVNNRVITTSGYSIENDLIIDGNLLRLLTPAEKAAFQNELEKFIHWYSLALNRHISSGSEVIKHHPERVFENFQTLTELKEGETFPEELRQAISDQPLRLVRGKSLLRLLVSHLSYPGRNVKHHHKALIELVASTPGELLNAIFGKVGENLGSPEKAR